MWSTILPLLLLSPSAIAVNNGLARTPQMGWNNWNSLGCNITQPLILDTATKLIDLGLRDIGYNYVVMDDCWSDGRGSDGYIKVDQKKFPNGMKWMAEQLHSMGLLFGMYSSAGEFTCARYAGSLDHETQDAESWALWDVDYLKYDNCYHLGRFGFPEVSFNRYNVMAKALQKTGRSILYSICSWGEDYIHTWGSSISNSWRISGDIYDSFNRPDDLCTCVNPADPHCVAPGTHCSVMYIINRVAPFVDRGHPGAWNDLDMLEVGHGGMTDEEYKAHFSMWAAIKSPLLIGADIRHLSPQALSILNNPAVVAVSQDPLGKSVSRIARNYSVPKDKYGQGETQIWSGPLYPSDQVVIFLNAADTDLDMSTTLSEIFVHEGPGGSAPQAKESWDMYDLWAGRMPDSMSSQIVAARDGGKIASSFGWYNSTEIPYAAGLAAGDERLFGVKTGVINAGENTEVKVKVPRHGVKMFRLRCHAEGLPRYNIARDEL